MEHSELKQAAEEHKIIMIEMDSESLLTLWKAASGAWDDEWQRFGKQNGDLSNACDELREELIRHGLDPLRKRS